MAKPRSVASATRGSSSSLLHPRLPRNPRSIFAVINHPTPSQPGEAPSSIRVHSCPSVVHASPSSICVHLRAPSSSIRVHSCPFVVPHPRNPCHPRLPLFPFIIPARPGTADATRISFPLSGRGATASLSACKPKRPSARAAVPGGPGSSPFWSASRALSCPCPCGTSAARRSRARSRRSSG